MFNIIPLILILISLAIIIIIVARKFSILANLDINTIQAEKEAMFKEQIIGKRIKRNILKYYSRTIRILMPLGTACGNFFIWVYKKLVEFKENYNKEDDLSESEGGDPDRLFAEVEELLKSENYDEVEKKYIEIIAIDSKNIKAFRGLGQLYQARKDYNEAKQTFEHALKLMEKNVISGDLDSAGTGEGADTQLAGIYFDLARTHKAIDSYREAIVSLDKALSIEPSNPRFLDSKLSLSIIEKDKETAAMTFKKLSEVNPENQKLNDFKEEIDKL